MVTFLRRWKLFDPAGAWLSTLLFAPQITAVTVLLVQTPNALAQQPFTWSLVCAIRAALWCAVVWTLHFEPMAASGEIIPRSCLGRMCARLKHPLDLFGVGWLIGTSRRGMG